MTKLCLPLSFFWTEKPLCVWALLTSQCGFGRNFMFYAPLFLADFDYGLGSYK